MGPTSCVVMSYTINQSKQTATAKYVFDGGTEVPNGEKRVSVVYELIIPTKNGETVIKNKSNGNGEYSRLEKMTKTVALTDAEKAAGYKIQFVDISIIALLVHTNHSGQSATHINFCLATARTVAQHDVL